MNSNQNAFNSNMIFYKKDCQLSHNFLTLCQQNNILKYFKLIAVDNTNIQKINNGGINVFPTLLIKGLSVPLEGKAVFGWLEEHLRTINANNNQTASQIRPPYPPPSQQQQNNSNNISSQSNVVKRPNPLQSTIDNNNQNNQNNNNQNNNNHNNNNQNINSMKEKKDVIGFSQFEMAGISDAFAYVNRDEALPKNFLAPDKNVEIYTATECKKINNKQHDMLIKNISTKIENDKKEILNLYDKEHEKIINGNKIDWNN